MRAVVMRDKRLIVTDVPVPEPAPGEVLVKTLACGICGSDLHALKHADRFAAAYRRPDGTQILDLTRDVMMGHEFCAEIVDHGLETTRRLKTGTRVCSVPVLQRPAGRQTIGYSNDHPGGYGEYMCLTEALLLPVPNGLATEQAALGADVVVDPARRPAIEGWREVAHGRPLVIFECVGVPGLLDQAMTAAVKGTRIVIVGVCMEPDTIQPMLGISKELSLQFVLGYDQDEFAATLRHIAESAIPTTSLITDTVGVGGVAEAFVDLASPERHVKILVEPWR